ncbi:MAG: hypothetical protein AAGE96_08095 [Cyanobacteria bacterium P01_G01_bin.19]
MNKIFVGALSALALTSTTTLSFAPEAKAVLQMNFTAPFISNAGLANAAGTQHYFTVFITSLPLEGFRVNIPNDMRILKGATVEDAEGNSIAASTTIGEGTVEIDFDEPVEPETYLTVRLDGVEMDKLGGFAMYRVFGMWEDLNGTIPIGTARVRLRDES